MDAADPDIAAFECRNCGNIAFGAGEIRCCDGPMERVSDGDSGVESPDLEDVLRHVFDMSGTEFDVCLGVMETGETTARELAEALGYDRSVISRHLNHLAEIGAVEKRPRILKQGGHVYVYVPADPETVRQSFRRGLSSWVAMAVELIGELNREKVEALADISVDGGEWTVHREQ